MEYRAKSFKYALIALTCVGFLSQHYMASADTNLYRYKNEHGVQVINHSIPAEYTQQGYEIINQSGEVIKVVPRAPTENEVAAANAQRELLDQYKELKRRYSDVDGIKNAKQRKLDNITTNITILDGTIKNLSINIDDLVKNAAAYERTGRQVPESLTEQINATKAELKISQDMLSYRRTELGGTAKKFDADINTYLRGEKIEAQLEAERIAAENLANQR